MSKGNLFLGQARGSVGDVTFTHIAGVQVARARNRSPKNPQSVLQMVTRIIQASASKAYSMFMPICDHSFQGKATGTPNQSRFMQLNTAKLRDKLAAVIADPTEENALASLAYNFSYKGDQLPVFNDWIMSAGTLPVVAVSYDASHYEFAVGPILEGSDPSAITYQQIADALHAQAGDQLTILAVAGDPDRLWTSSPQIQAFEYARIILSPSNGNMSAPFLSASGANWVVNLPNERNEGDLSFAFRSNRLRVARLGTLYGESEAGNERWIAGAAAILSRRVGDTWERSTQQLVYVQDGALGYNWGYFSDAFTTYLRGESASPLYLNQANASAVNNSAGGPLEWFHFSTSSSTSLWSPVSRGRVPVISVRGVLYFPLYDSPVQPSDGVVISFSGGIGDLTSLGIIPVVVLEAASLDEAAAATAINAWFTPNTSFTGSERP